MSCFASDKLLVKTRRLASFVDPHFKVLKVCSADERTSGPAPCVECFKGMLPGQAIEAQETAVRLVEDPRRVRLHSLTLGAAGDYDAHDQVASAGQEVSQDLSHSVQQMWQRILALVEGKIWPPSSSSSCSMQAPHSPAASFPSE